MYIYDDPALPSVVLLQSPFRDATLTPDMQVAFNKSTSSATVSVEWIFGEVISSFLSSWI